MPFFPSGQKAHLTLRRTLEPMLLGSRLLETHACRQHGDFSHIPRFLQGKRGEECDGDAEKNPWRGSSHGQIQKVSASDKGRENQGR